MDEIRGSTSKIQDWKETRKTFIEKNTKISKASDTLFNIEMAYFNIQHDMIHSRTRKLAGREQKSRRTGVGVGRRGGNVTPLSERKG